MSKVVTRNVAVPLFAVAGACAGPAEQVWIDGSPGVAPLMAALAAAYRSPRTPPCL